METLTHTTVPTQFATARGLVFSVLAMVTVALEPWNAEVVRVKPGTGWVVPLLPLVPVLTVALLASAVLAAAGKLWPHSGWVACGLGFAVLAVPQMDGALSHYHHVLWFAVLLLVAKGDWVRPAWFLFGWVYLVPGLSKLAHLPLLLDGGMERTMNRVRDLHDIGRPIPGGSWFPQLTTLATIAVEVGVIVLVFTRWRPFAAAAGFSFHMGTLWVLGISFWSLTLLYPILFMQPEGDTDRAAWGWVILVAVASVGMGGSAWPFSIYPTFSNGV